MTISSEEAIENARRAATELGLRWEEPVRASRSRRFLFFGRVTFEVWTNADRRGANCRFVVDGDDGTVRRAYWLPR